MKKPASKPVFLRL